jgi:uncharacterized protein
MIFNVAQLLKSPIGSSQEEDFEEHNIQLDEDIKIIGPVIGHVRMRRISQGLLVDGWVDVTLELTCTRCLAQFEQPMHVPFEERFYPMLDIITGLPLPPPEEEDVFLINDHHEVDVTEAIRQQILLDTPMVTLCKEDCAGLCSQCGHDLNMGPCDCQPVRDERLSILNTLLQKND